MVLEWIGHYWDALLVMTAEMAPYLLLGFLFAGVLRAFVPHSLLKRHLSSPTLGSVVKAAALGVPLPLCSCGVIPTTVSLRKEGASHGACTSFLIATPQTGVDSIAATYSLMGLPFAIIRPLAALFTAVFGGWLVNRRPAPDPSLQGEESSGHEHHEHENCCGHERHEHESCCGHEHHEHECCCGHERHEHECCCGNERHEHESCCGHEHHEHESCCGHEHHEQESCCGHERHEQECCCGHEHHEHECCCGHEHEEENSAQPKGGLGVGWGTRLHSAMEYAFVEMLQDVGKWLVIGLLIAAFITVAVPNDWLAALHDYKLLNMLIVLAVAIPMYVCATGSIPIAVSLMAKGLTPGAALVLLMAGPAVNSASMLVIGKVFGRRTLWLYLFSIVVGAMAFGLCIDYLLPQEWFAVQGGIADGGGHCAHTLTAMDWAWMALLLVLLVNAFWKSRHGHCCHCHDEG